MSPQLMSFENVNSLRAMKLTSLGLTSAALLFSPVTILSINQNPSFALPGQTLQQLDQMLQNSRLFQGKSVAEAEFWAGSYFITIPYDGGTATLYFIDENGTIPSETVQFRDYNSKISFERDSDADLSLIAAIWGEGVAQDFANSSYTDVIETPLSPTHHYLGEEYGYSISFLSSPQIATFSVMTHEASEEAKTNQRFCLANPSHDECIGI